MQSIVYIGSDFHKSTFSLCALDGQTNQVLAETKCAAETKLIIKFINQMPTNCPADTKFIVGYEAGCLGYYLRNELVSKALRVSSWRHPPCTIHGQAQDGEK
ncbi:hypothetical protein [Lacticaseibacillus paracasei]|uniref:hypothetical protein n=1 Tax=Lacticaseibacillus paracasei TaxID=1597 RepID=UPI001E42AB29|nr:hypothetical protein [Lacticaseibacillus paracasei]